VPTTRYEAFGLTHRELDVGIELGARFVDSAIAREHFAREDQRLSLGARGGELALHEQEVDASFGWHRRTLAVAAVTRCVT